MVHPQVAQMAETLVAEKVEVSVDAWVEVSVDCWVGESVVRMVVQMVFDWVDRLDSPMAVAKVVRTVDMMAEQLVPQMAVQKVEC
jgi:hypothetical protein